MMSIMNKFSDAKRAAILTALVEGNSIQSTRRMVGVSINTVTKLLVDADYVCARYQNEHLGGGEALMTEPAAVRGVPGSSVARLMGLVAMVALAIVWPWLWLLVAPILADRLAGGLLGASWGRALAFALGAVYCPCAIGFFSDCDHCRGVWAMIWPVVPGLLAGEGLRRAAGFGRSSDLATFALAGALTLVWVVLATVAAQRGRAWRVVALLVTFVLSAAAAIAAYSLVRS